MKNHGGISSCARFWPTRTGGRLHIHSHPLQLPLVFQAVADVAVNGNNLLSHRKTGWFRVEFRLEPSNWASVVVDWAFRDNLIQELISHSPSLHQSSASLYTTESPGWINAGQIACYSACFFKVRNTSNAIWDNWEHWRDSTCTLKTQMSMKKGTCLVRSF